MELILINSLHGHYDQCKQCANNGSFHVLSVEIFKTANIQLFQNNNECIRIISKTTHNYLLIFNGLMMFPAFGGGVSQDNFDPFQNLWFQTPKT